MVNLGEEPGISDDLLLLIAECQEREKMPHLVINFSEVRHLNSSNISKLLRLRKLTIDGDTRLRLASIPDPAWAVFLTIGLDKIFEFAEDVPTALASLQIEPR